MTDATNTNTETNAVEPKLSAREKLLAKYNKLAERANAISAELITLAAEINAIDALAAVTVGAPVIVTIGKGEDAKEVEAVVVGVKEDEDGSKVYKVQYGSGFDADIAVVKQGKLKLPVAAPAEVAAE